MQPHQRIRRLHLILGDQLDDHSAIFDDFNPATDSLWMAEVRGESTHVWSHRVRTSLFLSAMRHFRDNQQKLKRSLQYTQLDDPANTHTLAGELSRTIEQSTPQEIRVVQPGDHRVQEDLKSATKQHRIPLTILPDRHFLSTVEQFNAHAAGRKQLRLEFFYRELRKQTGILMEGDKPIGGEWNYDAENRGSFGKKGPGRLSSPMRFVPDKTTTGVISLVQREFATHPGNVADFDWPVTPSQAKQALDDFITHRLPNFGQYQDAMWTQEPWLYHSRISAALNLKLLHPREVIQAAEKAYQNGDVPLAAAEGFIRQILGWREYVRGIYWRFMPEYLNRNALRAELPLPTFYWTGETEAACLRDTIQQTLRYGYAHHIQRLMVTGLFALLYGVKPQAVHEWYLAVYVDAVEWVELPNTLGMSQYADGGVMASKPYAASGAYINRMSNYCQGCRYNTAEATGDDACPFTTLYWDFLIKHEAELKTNQRMAMQLKNVARLDATRRLEIQRQAEKVRARFK